MAPQRQATDFDDLEDEDDDRSPHSDDMDNDVLPAVDEDGDDSDENIPSTSTARVPVAVPSASAVTIAAVLNGPDDRRSPILNLELSLQETKRKKIIPPYKAVAILPPPEFRLERKVPPLDETRRLFQRLWTDEDEIELLQGFLHYSNQRGGGGPQLDTTVFYDQIKSKLQLDFNKNQLAEKLRRLKKKYRTVIGKINSGKEFSFKSPHDQATFDISKKIWSNSHSLDEDGDVKLPEDHSNRSVSFSTPAPPSRKRPRPASRPAQMSPITPAQIEGAIGSKDNENTTPNGTAPGGSVDDDKRNSTFPLLKELMGGCVPSIPGLVMNAIPLGLGMMGDLSSDRWRKQQIMELEAYSKRLELVQDLIREHLKELRTIGSDGG